MGNEIVANGQYLRASLRDFLVFIALLLAIRWHDLSLQQSKWAPANLWCTMGVPIVTARGQRGLLQDEIVVEPARQAQLNGMVPRRSVMIPMW
jgi:hypothetical protein